MPALSDAQIAVAARGAGLSGEPVAVAVAVALAESGGVPTAHNAIPPDNSYGLWQINMLGPLGTDRRQRFNLPNNEALYDPATNARVMAALSNGGRNWGAWTTYTSGVYLRFLARGRAAAGGGLDPIPIPELTPRPSTNPLSDITGFLQRLTDSRTWVRVGFFVWGGVMLLIALTKMTGDNQLSQGTKTLGRAIAGVIPGGGTVVQGVKTAAKVVK